MIELRHPLLPAAAALALFALAGCSDPRVCAAPCGCDGPCAQKDGHRERSRDGDGCGCRCCRDHDDRDVPDCRDKDRGPEDGCQKEHSWRQRLRCVVACRRMSDKEKGCRIIQILRAGDPRKDIQAILGNPDESGLPHDLGPASLEHWYNAYDIRLVYNDDKLFSATLLRHFAPSARPDP